MEITGQRREKRYARGLGARDSNGNPFLSEAKKRLEWIARAVRQREDSRLVG